MAIVAIIPARYGSTRLPGKPLSDIHGKPMIQHVHEAASRARRVERVLVATDDMRIVAAVRAFGGEAILTSTRHATGTDRLAEAAQKTDASIVVNVQGDEPMLDPTGIDAALGPMLDDASVAMSTLSLPLTDAGEMLSPTVVKVVTDARGDALYFSRSPIPHLRLDPPQDDAARAAEAIRRGLPRKHIGLYVYRREALARFASLPRSPLEEAEGLEQLRALHHGIRIRVVPFQGRPGVAVDTPEDLERVRGLMKENA
ncbi:MAG TPA: 3-deoxy-manno-octulosonate cytidylyltransferase [Vicinamibacteria bacterium]|nr:3-deoxy-manno-octulosonate cytidylyltransferase [Vicinamibacteria bacterium]